MITPRPAQVVMSMAIAISHLKAGLRRSQAWIADLVAEGPLTCEEMAVSRGVSPDALCRVMRGLALMQMVYNGGRERTLLEYRNLIEAAGLRIHQTMATPRVISGLLKQGEGDRGPYHPASGRSSFT